MEEKHHILRLLPFFAFFLVLILSCGGEALNKGCTDFNALNYNPDADIYDGSCEYERDKFYGTYSGTSVCDTSGAWHNTTFQLTINSDIRNTDDVRLFFLLPTGNQINVVGKVRENNRLVIESLARANPVGFCGFPHGQFMFLDAHAILHGNEMSFFYFNFEAWGAGNDPITCFQVCEVEAVKN